MSIPSSYSIVPQVYHRKEHLHSQVPTFQGTVDGSAEVAKQALIEEYRWLETVVETHQTESTIPSWSNYHSKKEHNVPSVKRYHSLLSLIDAPIIMKTIEYLNPCQIAVDGYVISQCMHLQKKNNIEIQKNVNQVHISV